MLKLLKKISPSHEDLFIEHYQRLLSWSLQLTDHDRDLAEDLLHDAFIHFTTLTQPDLNSIQNLDGYFYGMLRNLHLSQERRSSRSRFQQLSIVEYESAATGLRTIDTRDLIQVQDELRRVCYYACARKETAKLASVLILRFFHGYYPSEIARILRSPRPAIDKWLQLARAEAKLGLTEPKTLGFKDAIPPAKFLPASIARTSGDLLSELRQQIFQVRRGKCLSAAELKQFYQASEPGPMDCAQLSHVVSCPPCLDEINVMLKLPPLTDRYPTDSIGKDTTPKGGGEGGTGTGDGGSAKTAVRRYRRCAREAFEHRPQELCVSVNGYIQGSHKIGSEKVEFDLSANLAEAVGFVEIFSEQGIRLLLLNAEEPPPHGSDVQTMQAKLSDDRTLQLTLKLRSPWPTVHLVYNDPTFKAVESGVWSEESVVELSSSLNGREGSDSATASERREASSAFGGQVRPGASTEGRHDRITSYARQTVGAPLRGRPGLFARLRTLDWRLFLRPGIVTSVIAALLVTLALFVSLRKPTLPITAGDLLARASAAEDVLSARTDQVIHRTINFEEKQSTGELIAHRRIEIWHSAAKGITARRLYDDRGALIAGDWRRADGVQTLYHHGAKPQLQLAPEKRHQILVSGDVWQLEPSAKDFTSLLSDGESAQVEETPNSYVITYTPQAPVSNDPGLVVLRAALTLTKSDLHATELRLVVKHESSAVNGQNPALGIRGQEIREFRLVESRFERRPNDDVEPALFEPDLELISSVAPARNPNTATLPATTQPLSPVMATAALEVEVIDLLNSTGAFMGEQISVQRTPEGKLEVNALVETAQRKTELLNAVASVKANPAVRMNIETVAEAQAREARKKTKQQAPGDVTVNRFEATEDTSPVYSDLRRKFSDQEARSFADRILRRSQQARRHALAMKQLSERFSLTDLQTLNATERARWIGLIRGHANKFLSETDALRRELQTVFSDLGGGGAESSLDNNKEIQLAVRRLYDLSVACDEDLRGSFALFTNTAGSAEVKTVKFWRALNNAAALAQSLQSTR